MDFGSDHLYWQIVDEYECVSDEEFKDGMQLSDSDSGSDSSEEEPPAKPAPRGLFSFSFKKKPQKPAPREKKIRQWKIITEEEYLQRKKYKKDKKTLGKKWFRRADTNVVSVNFNTLLAPSHMHAGDPVVCSSCQSILSHISKTDGDADNKRWRCEFCDSEMHVDVEDEEIPKDEDVTYLMEPGNATKSTTLSGHDESLVLFCVDTSGSMCVTTEVEGKVNLRGTSHLQRLESFNPEGEDQYLPSQRRRNVSYISRLQAMQAAVDDQLGTMAKDNPHRRVGLITFSSDVTVVGDGHQEEVTLAGDKLIKPELLKKEGSEMTLPQAIRTSRTVLGDKVYRLEEGGSTALGPALIIAVSMASHHPGSKVILCTDGKANVGFGKLEDDKDEQNADAFYSSVGERAVSKGVSISVITIKGTDCKLVHLGRLADKTGGQVNIVDPLNLTNEFKNILDDPIIATNVKAKLLVHKALYVVNEEDPNKQECYGEFNPGNVKSSSAITFEFGRRPIKDAAAPETVTESPEEQEESADEPTTSSQDPAQPGATAMVPTSAKDIPSDYPFQLQIHYTDTEGRQALRVITRTLPATSDRSVAEKNANMDVLGVHAAKKSADLALQGLYSESRGVAFMNQRFAWRKSHSEVASKQDRAAYRNIYSKIKGMENLLQKRQQSEIELRGNTRSDSEDDDDDCSFSLTPPPARRKSKLRQERSTEMDDTLANVAYNLRHTNRDQMAAPLEEEESGK